MPTPLYINIDQRLFEETLLRMLSQLDPDPHTASGKRDMSLKAEVDSLLSYLTAAKPILDQSMYPVPKSRR